MDALTDCSVRHDRLEVIMSLARENTHSLGTLVAGMQRDFGVTWYRAGN